LLGQGPEPAWLWHCAEVRSILVLLLACAPLACASAARSPLSNHAAAKKLAADHPRSEVLPEADYIISAMDTGDVAPVVEAMTSKMQAKYRKGRLDRVSKQVREHYGKPVGIVEERVHQERDLTWYSGLILYTPSGRARHRDGTLLLYQFALENQRLTRLLIREHPFRDDVAHPADEYMTVNRFAFPSSDEWTLAHGGRDEETNKHHRHRGQRYAYDIIIKRNGRTGRGKRSNSDYYCYGKILVAPAPGRVVFARDGVAENKPGERGDGGGNGVIIDHGFGERSSLWHMIPGSVRVKKGDVVKWGQELGRVGNSGRSTAPHIHFHVDTTAQRGGRFALPADFVDAVVDDDYENRVMPIRGQRIRRSKAHRIHSSPRPLIDL
jgi:murein DD-endopeptidase MepM/ murein hydrolase activator NlpD